MVSLDKSNGIFNVLSPKICVPKETKDINVKVFNMITNKNKNKNETRTMQNHFSCNCKCKFNTTTINSKQKWNNKTCQCECKNYRTFKKDYSWNPITCICENIKYLKSIVVTLAIECDEIIPLMDTVSTKMTNAIATNVMSTILTNYDNKKVRYKIDCYILHTVLLAIILLLIITIVCYHYAKHRSKQKGNNAQII